MNMPPPCVNIWLRETASGGTMNGSVSASGGTHSIKGVLLPKDPADLFVVLYDLLPERPFLGLTANQWHADLFVHQLADEICEEATANGTVDTARVEKIFGQHGEKGIFAALTGLDQVLGAVNPFSGARCPSALNKIARRYNEKNQLNDPEGPTTGLLLPRCTRPGKLLAQPTGRPDFFNVHRVTADDCRNVRHIGFKQRNGAHFSGKKAIPIGSAPLLESYDDLKFDFHQVDGTTFYKVSTRDERLRDRIDHVVKNLDESGAEIGVMPESTLSNALYDHWKTHVGTEPEGSRLRWVLLGTGPLGEDDPPPNRAVLVDRSTGETILTHDKVHGFTMGKGQADRWQLPRRPDHERAAEYLERGEGVTVVETAIGRVAVLICEDIKQSTDWEAPLRAFGVSHLFVPLLSSPISRAIRRWDRLAAERCVEVIGAWVVLANSLAVGDRMNLPPENRFNTLVVGPRLPRSLDNGDHVAQFARSENGTELARVVEEGQEGGETRRDPEGGPLPTIVRGGTA
ncbi:hypothetical protein [Streptomyces sp. NPDC088360]|uniref:hypothetical protein n=2 Tax=unclassified Streptomyces TaxID=2593676 RepID=UPI00344DA4CC